MKNKTREKKIKYINVRRNDNRHRKLVSKSNGIKCMLKKDPQTQIVHKANKAVTKEMKNIKGTKNIYNIYQNEFSLTVLKAISVRCCTHDIVCAHSLIGIMIRE